MGKHRVFLWQSCFGGCAKVDDFPSPRPSEKLPRRQQSATRLSCSDVSTTDLSSSFLSANLIMFTIAELKAATQGFSSGNFIGEGGFGPVYKGHVDEKMRAAGVKAQVVAVKVLNLDGMQGHKEWMTEVILLGQLQHPDLVKLIGYCYEADNRMLVYEFMARGSLENHLFKRYASLSWEHRIKIAFGAAKGLAFLHGVDQQVIYRDFKASNILLDVEYKAKLSDFGLAKDGPEGDDTHVSTRVMGTHGYAAPEYVMTGHLTAKSDVYSFGVVLLELLTGRRSVDNTRPSREQNLVDWARPSLTNPRKLNQIIDPQLEGQFSAKGAQKAAELAYHCLSHLPKSRPDMSAVVEVLEPILNYKDILPSTFVFHVNGTNGKPDSHANSKEGSMVEKQTVEDRERDAKKPKTFANHRNRHRHRNNRRQRGMTKATVYSDTALYRKTPRRFI